MTKISESSEILQTLTCSDESGNSYFTAAKLHCPSYREKGINARQHKKKNNILIKTTRILWLFVCRAQNTAPRAGSDPLGSPLDWGGKGGKQHSSTGCCCCGDWRRWRLSDRAMESCQITTNTAPPACTGTDAWQELVPSPSLARISCKTGALITKANKIEA